MSVFVNARHVGTLKREATGAIAFAYARDWLYWTPAFPVSLSLPLREERFVGTLVIEIAPRHFVETADLAGVGRPVMHAIIEQIAKRATRVVDEVAEALPGGFPESLVESVAAAVARRSRLCAEAILR